MASFSESGKRGRGRPKKDRYDMLTPEFKDAVANGTPEEINRRIAEIAKGAAANQELLKADPEVIAAADNLKGLKSGYVETKKTFAQQLAWCRETLSNKGKDNTGSLELRPGQEPVEADPETDEDDV